MVTVKLWGQEYPLCLTVGALDQINEKCGSLTEVSTFLDGGHEKNYQQMLVNTAWMLSLLMQEGEENRLVLSRYGGTGECERRDIPDHKAICSGLTLQMAAQCRLQVLAAINESLTQKIEADYGKKKESVEQG